MLNSSLRESTSHFQVWLYFYKCKYLSQFIESVSIWRWWSPKHLKLGFSGDRCSLSRQFIFAFDSDYTGLRKLLIHNKKVYQFLNSQECLSCVLWTRDCWNPHFSKGHIGAQSVVGLVRTQCSLFASLRNSWSQTRSLWTCSWAHIWIYK